MMQTSKLTCVELSDPVVDMDAMTVNFSFAANVLDMADQVIVDACVKAAREAGITQLYLLDKRFIVEAIWDKLEKDSAAEP